MYFIIPKKDGLTLSEEIQEYASDTPFLFLTSEINKKKRIKGLKPTRLLEKYRIG